MAAQIEREGSAPAVSCVGLRLERETQPYRCGSKDTAGCSPWTNSDSQSPTLDTNRTKPGNARPATGWAMRHELASITREVIERTRRTKTPAFVA